MNRATKSLLLLIACLALVISACDKSGGDPPKADAPTTAAPTAEAADPNHARAGAKPGSHEDWCGEHQVPESMCTRCNGSLTAAFKATGDWCEEHQLPESQCLKCNPELKIVRPPPAVEANP